MGATTQVGLVAGPLRDRFGFQGRLQPYNVDALAKIVSTNAKKLNLDMDDEAAEVIAGRSRGTPRVANSLLNRVRDVAEVQELSTITADVAVDSMEQFGIDELGLDEVSRHVLSTLCTQFNGGPVGLNSLASAVDETSSTLETVYEPHLMAAGMLRRGRQGRTATERAFQHLGLQTPGK